MLLPALALAASLTTIIGRNDLEPARGLFGAVARVSTAEAAGYCTGFVVGEGLVMTNEHCANSCDGLRFEFGYEDEDVPPRAVVSCERLVLSDYFLDFAIFAVGELPADAEPVTLSRASPAVGTPLSLVGHPGGMPKQIDRGDECVVIRGPNPSPRTLYHTCDTLSGSSGAPIFRREDQHVVGLHNRSGSDFNAGLRMAAILTHVEAVAPDVYPLLRVMR